MSFELVERKYERYKPYNWREIMAAALDAGDGYMLKCEFDTPAEAKRVANLANGAKYRYGEDRIGVSLKYKTVYIYRRDSDE